MATICKLHTLCCMVVIIFSVQEMMAVGYNVDGTQAVLTDLGWVSPAGQMYSSTRDLDTVSQ